ncbi:right-handed parallel beta-helix repeat-containing protein [Dyadobacter endophyticus]|uniref:right-handed parallel beta-helix repeat-containing protein n=1 Tax=Dyadobacter TaxID=120831 RepID=UPI003CF182A8
MKYLGRLFFWVLFLPLLACQKQEVATDECNAAPTACGCPEAPASCETEIKNPGALSGKVYVSPSGNDNNDGSESKPFKTIQKAADSADPSKGIEIILRDGTYESREIKFRTSNVYMHSFPGEWAVIRAVTNVEDIASCIWFREPGTANVTLENLEITGGFYYGIKFESDWDDDRSVSYANKKGISNVRILSCKIHDTGRDCIKITPGCKDIQILNCEIYKSGVGPANIEAQNAEGIDNVNADRMVVKNCYFHDIATNALYAKGGAKDCVFEQNLIMNCGEGGLLAGYLDTDSEWFNTTTNPNYHESIDIIIRNNIVVNTKREGIGLYAASGAQVYNNTIVNAATDEGSSALIISRGEIYGTPGGDRHPVCKDLKIANNIFIQSASAKGSMARLRLKPTGTNDIGNNFYYRQGGLTYRIDRGEDDYEEFEGFSLWKSKSGFDSNSSNVDPRLNTQYHLSGGSPCIGKGKSLENLVEKDYDGADRGSILDIGADQLNNGNALTIPPTALPVGTKGTGGN